MDEREAYAIGYFHGRAYGNDEEGISELGDRKDFERLAHAFKEGYERGVTDYTVYDLGTQEGR